jgi:hypothetical protein
VRETIELIESSTGEFVEAELLDEITIDHFLETKRLWQPLLLRATQLLRQRNPNSQLPDYGNWDWTKKEPYLHLLATKFFGITCRNKLQGIALVQTQSVSGDCHCRLLSQRGKPLLYLDYVQVAPWNIKLLMDPIGQKTDFQGVGSRLMEAVIRYSIDEGFNGRVGLHSLPSSEQYYEVACGMTAVSRDLRKQNLLLFEHTPDQAQAFLAGDSV